MSEKQLKKTNKRKTSRKYAKKPRFMVRNLKELVHIMMILAGQNKTPILNDIIDKTSKNIEEFVKQYSKLPIKAVMNIENDISNVIYNRKVGIKAKLFGYVELISDFRIYLNKEKYQNILQICDDMIDNLQHFILILNDSSYHED
jgi:hypothetical protein